MRTHNGFKLGVVLLLLTLCLGSVARAAPGPGHILRAVVASGGARVQAAQWVLNGTVGQSVVGPVVRNGSRGVASGFWHKVTGGGVVSLPVIRK